MISWDDLQPDTEKFYSLNLYQPALPVAAFLQLEYPRYAFLLADCFQHFNLGTNLLTDISIIDDLFNVNNVIAVPKPVLLVLAGASIIQRSRRNRRRAFVDPWR